eukprot:evm.model.scf_429.6 EVM.evm.TU.scf_429.6   scf_429:73960-80091(+)
MTAPAGRFPYLVAINMQSHEHQCSGVLLNDCFVLTAAHCISSLDRDIAVIVTRVDPEGSEAAAQEMEVDAVSIHPRWTGNLKDGYDAALLRLSTPVDGQPPLLAPRTSKLYPGTAVFLLRPDVNVQMAQYSVMSNDFFSDFASLESHMFCAHSERAGLQSGDVGGPAIIPHRPSDGVVQDLRNSNGTSVDGGSPGKDVLVGVLSCVNASATERAGGIFTRIANLRGWIEQYLFQADEGLQILGKDSKFPEMVHKGSSGCSGRAYGDQWVSQQYWDGWLRAPRGRFEALVSIRGRGREHVCTGVIVSPLYILTSANCIDIVGPNPIVIIGPQTMNEDRRTKGVQVSPILAADSPRRLRFLLDLYLVLRMVGIPSVVGNEYTG